MNRLLVFLICFVSTVVAQQLPYGKPTYFSMGSIEEIEEVALDIPSSIPKSVFKKVKPIVFNNRDHYFLKIHLIQDLPVQFKLSAMDIIDGMDIYFIDLEIEGWVGPYSRKTIPKIITPLSDILLSQNILIEISVPVHESIDLPVHEILSLKKPNDLNGMSGPMSKDKDSLGNRKDLAVILDDFLPVIRPRQRDHSRNILLAGYWPPSNECIRPFSTNEVLNPDGWIGDNWEERGYDIHSYFPTFSDPDCEDCGQGNGDLEIDYQVTSEDWWNIVDSINPVAIITFSRGGMDYRWEIEWLCTNWEGSEWIADFEEPLYPTPSPPDSTYPHNTPRYSSLPMDSIYSAVSLSGLNTYPVIDYTYGTGNYLSEFMGYHGLWYKSQMDSINIISSDCHLAGHIHVGGFVDWDVAHEAAKISLREVIKVLDESEPIIGDVNYDGLISILDLYFLISYLMGEIQFDENGLIIGDFNFDSSVDILDLLLISNIILDS